MSCSVDASRANDGAIRNDTPSGLALRESLFNGTLSAAAQHALMHMTSLRQGLIGQPVTHEVRKAVVTARMNPNLRAVLLSEISLAGNTPTQAASPGQRTPGSGRRDSWEQSANRPEYIWSQAGSLNSTATPSGVAGTGSDTNAVHPDAGGIKRKRGEDPSTDNLQKPYPEGHTSPPSETTASNKRSGFAMASRLMSSLFTMPSRTASDPQREDSSEGAGVDYGFPTGKAQEHASSEGADSHRDTEAETASLEEYDQHVTEALTKTPKGRLYIEWNDNGDKTHTHGALLPDNYAVHSSSDHPWVCPVVDCRYRFPNLRGLGVHFSRDHASACMNDNGNGTLSVVNYRKGTGHHPAIVISRTLGPRQPPTTIPTFSVNNVEESRNCLRTGRAPTYADQRLQKEAESAASTWDIIHPHLGDIPYSSIPQKGHVRGLLPLTRKRDVEFNSQSNKFFVSRPQDISAMVIQITGNESTTACARCRQGKGPFKGCVVVSTSAPDDVKQSVKSCANCYYKGNQTYCDLAKLQLGGQPLIPAEPPLTEPGAPTEKTLSEKSGRRPNGVSLNSSDAVSSGFDFSFGNEGSSVVKNTLEDWEVAPGRIRDARSPGIENVAFSSSYLTHSEEVAVNRDLGFNVFFVKGGAMHRWEATANKLRICSVATGKVKVAMLDQVFEIGRNGMFKIKSDTSCTVENPYYGEATLHVCTVPDDYDN